jgi:hypothetical protein
MLSYNIVLVSYEILIDRWLNLNRLHTCAPIEKLKELKGVPRVRAPLPPRRVMRAWCDMTCRARAWVGFATWAGYEWGRGTCANVEELLGVSYRPLWCLISLALSSLPSPCCLTCHTIPCHTIPSSCRVVSKYSPSHSLCARSFGRAGLRNWRLH